MVSRVNYKATVFVSQLAKCAFIASSSDLMEPLHYPVTADLSRKEQCAINSDDEAAPLLVKKTSSTLWSRCILRYKTTRKCVSSKSALLILLWSFVLGLWNGIPLNPDLFLRNFTFIYSFAGYGFMALVFCFFPLAGFLADVKYGRYKMVTRSLCTFLFSAPPLVILGAILLGGAVLLIAAINHGLHVLLY